MKFANNPECRESFCFFEGDKVVRHLDEGSFRGLLARTNAETKFANQERQAAYVRTDPSNLITHVTLFLMQFDEKGYIAEQWRELPLCDLAERAGKGPDLGAGPILLACRTQCCISWHVNSLWDPVDGNRSEVFKQLQIAINDLDQRTEKPATSLLKKIPAILNTPIPLDRIPELLNTPIPLDKIPELLNTPIPLEKIPEILNTPIPFDQVQKLLRKNISALKNRYLAREHKLIKQYQKQIEELTEENERLKLENQIITDKANLLGEKTETVGRNRIN